MSLATMMGLVHCCFLVLVLALIMSGLGGNNSSNAQDVKKCDYKKIVACLDKQVRWIPKRFSERHHNKTNVTTSDDMFLKEVCRRNASECLRHSQSDGCVTEQRNTLDRFTKANTAALKALCENRMEILKELYNDFLSWDIEGFKKCCSSMNVSAVAQDIFSVERSQESCRTLLNEVGRCMRNSYKKKTLEANSTKAAEQILTSFFNEISCQKDTEETTTDEGLNDRTTRKSISATSLLPGLNLLDLAKPGVSDTRTQEVTFDNQEASLKVSVGTTEEMKNQPRTSPSNSGPAVFFRSTASVFLVTVVTAALNLIL